MKSTKILKSFYKISITSQVPFICLFSSCNEEEEETLQAETIGEGIPELPFSKSISLEDEDGNTISFDVPSNVQAELDGYSASSFEFKAITQENLLAEEEEIPELSTGDPIVFKETNIHLNKENGFVAYRLIMKSEVIDSLEDRQDRRSYDFYSTSAIRAIVNSRKAALICTFRCWHKQYCGNIIGVENHSFFQSNVTN